ncbi:hypothetical protein IQ269_05910 [Tychonema sp. LEGE 07199]|uniref:hypothetical protein n=1 Tax=unclassified Tychonema TaxID=2642144 RepID=UPI00188110E2|nr:MULTISPECIES: hypothetical protein [unclassified Tychonema]MBE9120357.1 hypothetical protein [Tychonema sp. LEGE 07199]MBE9130651.1 hypothetical protein [Tychonema sp. LEGE 07196]
MNEKENPNEVASEVASKVKSTLNDAIQGLKIFLVNPVGGLPVFFQGLGKERALGVGIAFGIAYVICFVLACQKILTQFSSNSSLFNLILASTANFLSIAGASFLTRKLFRGYGSFQGDIFIAGVALVPASLLLLISSILGITNVEIIVIVMVVAITYTILMIYTGCHKISGIPETAAAFAVSVMLVLSGWLFKILILSNILPS